MGAVCIVPTIFDQVKQLLEGTGKYLQHDDRCVVDTTGHIEDLRSSTMKIILVDMSHGTRLDKICFWGKCGKTENRRILGKISGMTDGNKNWALSIYGPGLMEIARDLAEQLASQFDADISITQVTSHPVYEFFPENGQGD